MFFSLLLLLILLLIIINYYYYYYYYYYYLNCPAPSTSLSNETCGYSGGSMQFAIAADKHGLGLSYIKCKLVSIQPELFSTDLH